MLFLGYFLKLLLFPQYPINENVIVTGFWKTDHIVTREINRITMFMYL